MSVQIRTGTPVGERPIAFAHNRFEWLYVTGDRRIGLKPIVQGVWARPVGAEHRQRRLQGVILVDFARRIVFQLDKTGRLWRENLVVPDGIRLSSPPTVPSSNRPNTFGRSSTNRSPTADRHHREL